MNTVVFIEAELATHVSNLGHIKLSHLIDSALVVYWLSRFQYP